jgi:phosphoglycerol geranylgeranyltransferase
MRNSYPHLLEAKARNQKLLAILLDPDKLDLVHLDGLVAKINESPATHILVGGSSFEGSHLDEIVIFLKQKTTMPILLFPGNPSQISAEADGILFLQLLSGRNPDYLIEHQIDAVPILEKTNLEIISTGYILIESGSKTAVERVTQTKPLDRNDFEYVAQTAKAGELIGNKLIYLEAGSGAQRTVPLGMIKAVAERISVPLIVGGGIRSKIGIEEAFNAGADMVVMIGVNPKSQILNPKCWNSCFRNIKTIQPMKLFWRLQPFSLDC